MSTIAPLCCIDVHYADTHSATGTVLFQDWTDPTPLGELIHIGPEPEAYEPGAFYKRELPCVVGAIAELGDLPRVVVVDSYVWLGRGKKGMGAYVYDALGVPVIGVAKRAFAGAAPVELLRGQSQKPLYITAAGVSPEQAAAWVKSMHGPYRIPTLFKRADRLCRDNLLPNQA